MNIINEQYMIRFICKLDMLLTSWWYHWYTGKRQLAENIQMVQQLLSQQNQHVYIHDTTDCLRKNVTIIMVHNDQSLIQHDHARVTGSTLVCI